MKKYLIWSEYQYIWYLGGLLHIDHHLHFVHLFVIEQSGKGEKSKYSYSEYSNKVEKRVEWHNQFNLPCVFIYSNSETSGFYFGVIVNGGVAANKAHYSELSLHIEPR